MERIEFIFNYNLKHLSFFCHMCPLVSEHVFHNKTPNCLGLLNKKPENIK